MSRDSRERPATTVMTPDPDPEHPDAPPEASVDLAFRLVLSAAARDIDYEEYAFEVEGGMDDGVEYKVLVIRV